MRTSRITEDLVRWILGRAGARAQIEGGAVVPALSYAEIAAHLKRSRKVSISRRHVLRIVQTRDPELHRWRVTNALTIARLKGEAGEFGSQCQNVAYRNTGFRQYRP